MQAKLLRVIQEKEIQRVGGKETLSVDVRILAATNRNLEEPVYGNSECQKEMDNADPNWSLTISQQAIFLEGRGID